MITDETRALTELIARGGSQARSDFSGMIEALPVAVYTTDEQGRLTYFNPAAVKLSGRVPVLGTDQWCIAWKLYYADGTRMAHDECPMALGLKGGETEPSVECIAERPDGSRFWFMPHQAILRDGAGQITGGMNLLFDITDRKKAEMEASAHYRAVVEATPECVKIVAQDGTLLYMNGPGLGMIGAPNAESVIGKRVYDLVAPEDRERFLGFNEKICAGEKGSLEFDIIGLHGKRCHMETHAAPLRHAEGTTVHLAITRDISVRRAGERAAGLLGAIVDSSDDAIISKNLDGVITSWNKSAQRLFGYTGEETIGKPVTMLIPVDRLDEEPKILARLRRGERVDHFETVRRQKDGTLLDISLTISPVKDEQGNIVGASKIARDITERKRAEAEAKQIQDELRRANQDLEQFAFSASHDLQEPLRNIKIYTELLARDCPAVLDGEAKEYFTYVREGATRMEMLVRDLLSYTKVADLEIPADLVDSGEALERTLKGLERAIAEAGARIDVGPLPKLRVQATHLQQLFQNLIGNAIKYRSHDRALAVRVTAKREENQWQFSVTDNGIGIEPEYKEKIFGLFKRLHTSDEYPGTGIGLAICRRIVDRYHGCIWVESEPARGATFRFTLPV